MIDILAHVSMSLRPLCLTAIGLVAVFSIVRPVDAGPTEPGPQVTSSDSLLAGHPAFLRNFHPKEYGAHNQNWDVVQGRRGLMYVANTHGVLEYDGHRWRLIPTSNQSPVRSLAVGAEGRIFVGAVGEFGYLAPDETGRLEYLSLADRLPSSANSVTQNVWGTHVLGDAAYFQMYNRLVRWSADGFRTWTFEDTLHTSFRLRDTLVVRQENRGLRKLVGDSLRLMRGGAFFADPSVYALLPYGEGGYLAATYDRGLFVYENGRVRRVNSSGARYCRRSLVYAGTRLSDSLYALGTLEGGVAILDEDLELRAVLDEDSNLLDNRVYALGENRYGELWAGLYSGIARIRLSRRYRRFDERGGLRGAVQGIARHRGRLWVGTLRGLYRGDPEGGGDPRGPVRSFEPVDGLADTQVWSLLSVGSDLLAGGTGGVHAVTPTGVRRIETDFVFDLHRSLRDSGRVFVGSQSGLTGLEKRGGRWARAFTTTDLGGAARSIGVDSTGQVWVGRRGAGVSRVGMDSSGTPAGPTVSFGQEHGLPAGPVLVTDLRGVPLVISRSDTIFRPDPLGGPPDSVRFVPLGTVAPDLGSGERGADWAEGIGDSTLWVGGGREMQMLRSSSPMGSGFESAFRLRLPTDQIQGVYPGERSIWIGTNRGLLRVLREEAGSESPPPPVHIREVRVGTDSLVFGGAYGQIAGRPRSQQRTSARPRVPFDANRIRIRYASPAGGAPDAIQYQHRLEGFEDRWSGWTGESSVTYPYVPDGEYEFTVRARTMTGSVTPPATFRFSVEPPWYRTWWAYLLYVLGGAVALTTYIRYRTAASRRKLEKERILNERLQEANEQLEKTNQMKDEFLANLSHEIRTPMASIRGFAELIAEETSDPHRTFAERIQSSSRRLQETLTALLELAKFRAGELDPEHRCIDVAEEVRSAAELMAPQAREKGLRYSICVPSSSVTAYLDRVCLERIVNNLISNAIKFTEEGGEVEVVVSATRERVTIEVRDTGIGIEDEFQEELFNEFRQESAGLDRSHEGAGLGLALTHRMVGLLDGSISVESEKGEGSVFTVHLPRNGEGE